MKNGKIIAGLYGDKSYVTNYPYPSNIYLEEVVELDENNNLKDYIKYSCGVFIEAKNIEYIEFIKGTE